VFGPALKARPVDPLFVDRPRHHEEETEADIERRHGLNLPLWLREVQMLPSIGRFHAIFTGAPLALLYN
jgi:hypothetical protein